LRQAVYDWFDRWLTAQPAGKSVAEFPLKPRPADDLRVCTSGQAQLSFQSRHLLALALEDFERQKKSVGRTLRQVLELDTEMADFRIIPISHGSADNMTMIVCINGNEGLSWHEERTLIDILVMKGYGVVVIDPRGVGRIQPNLSVRGRDYCDPISGVEENIAYNAFLVGKSVLAMRVTDIVVAVRKLVGPTEPKKLVLLGRRDAALVACFAAAVEPSINRVAVEELLPSFRSLFSSDGRAINAASIPPGLLKHFGDVDQVLAQIGPRKVLVAGATPGQHFEAKNVSVVENRFTNEGKVLLEWLNA
jgi:hypothetical protein